VASPEEERWIWVAFAKESRLLLCIVVGPRIQESADKLIEGIDSCLDKKKELPLFVSDGNNQYTVALFNLYSEMITPDRTGKKGRPPGPYKIPRMDLRYAQVVKERKGGKLVKVHKKIIFGDKVNISQSGISTSHIERQNLTFRQENERLARKTIGFSKEDCWLERQMSFYMAFFDFVRPHSGLKLKIEPENDDITNRKYLERTPMMAVGKTNHIWSLEELLAFSCHKTSVN
jgi:IS1 family transposase